MILRATLPRLIAYVLVALIGVATTATVLRDLGATAAGVYFAVLSVGWVTLSISDFSLGTVALREASLTTHDDAAQVDVLRDILGFRLLAWTAAWWGLTAVLGGRLGVSLPAAFVVYVWLLLTIVTNVLSVPLQSRMRQGLVSTLLVVQAALALATAGALATVSAPVWAYLGVQVPGLLTATLVLLRTGAGRAVRRPRFDWRRMADLARKNWMIGASTVLALVANRMAPVITLDTVGALQAGLYGAAFRLVDAVEVVAALLMSVLLPILTRRAAQADRDAARTMRRTLGSMMLLGTAAGFTMAEWGPSVLPLLAGDAFAGLEDVFLPLSLFLALAFSVQPLNYTLVATRRYLPLLVACLGGAVTLLVSARAWSASSGAEGAAWATAAGYAVLLAIAVAGAARLGDVRELAYLLVRGAACAASTFAMLWLPVDAWGRTAAAVAILAVGAYVLRLADDALTGEVKALLRRHLLHRARRR